MTTTGNSGSPPARQDALAHDAFIRLLTRLEPDPQTLWQEAQAHIDLTSGILVLDDSMLEKPHSPLNAFVWYWSGKQQQVVEGIDLIILLLDAFILNFSFDECF